MYYTLVFKVHALPTIYFSVWTLLYEASHTVVYTLTVLFKSLQFSLSPAAYAFYNGTVIYKVSTFVYLYNVLNQVCFKLPSTQSGVSEAKTNSNSTVESRMKIESIRPNSMIHWFFGEPMKEFLMKYKSRFSGAANVLLLHRHYTSAGDQPTEGFQ